MGSSNNIESRENALTLDLEDNVLGFKVEIMYTIKTTFISIRTQQREIPV